MLINCPTSASVICRYKCRATKNRKLTGSQSVSWQFFTILLGLFYYSGTNIPEIDGVWGCTFYCPLLFPVSPFYWIPSPWQLYRSYTSLDLGL